MVRPPSANASSAPSRLPRSVPAIALALAVFAGLVAAAHAVIQQHGRTMPLDLDGWGFLIPRLQETGHDGHALFRDPSLWKGPVVPFLFGLAYYVAPFDESVLVLN